MSKAGEDRAEMTLREARELQRAARLDEARALCRQALLLQPGHAQALGMLGVLCIQIGNAHCRLQAFESAVACYDEALALRSGLDASAHYNRGIALQHLRRHVEAIASYDTVIAAKPEHAAAHNNRGSALNELGQYAAAIASHDRALALEPGNADAHNNRGNALLGARRFEEAVASYERCLALRPDEPRALNNRGVALARLHRYEAAIASHDAAIGVIPAYAEAHFNRANALKEQHRLPESLAAYDRCVEIDPTHAAAHSNRGIVLHELHRHDAALASFNRAIELEPGHAAAFCNRATTLRELQRYESALLDCETAIALDSRLAEAWCNRAAVLHELERPVESLADCEHALEIDPNLADAHFHRGMALRSLDRLEQAIASYSRAIALKAEFAAAYCNRGIAHYELRRFEAALADCNRALELEPDFAEAHFNRSLIWLITGDWARGWPEYEWRRRRKGSAAQTPDAARPSWLGAGSVQGSRILLRCEQGLGDTLQFCRYAGRLSDLGAQVILEVQEPLVPVLAGLRGVSRVFPRGDPLPEFDFHSPLLSMPLAFGTTLGSVPEPGGYLRADPHEVARWRERLGSRARPRIGLAWSGNPRNTLDRHRSLPLAELIGRLPANCDYFCLQKDVREEDLAALAGRRDLWRFPGEAGFAATAALCELMDAVVSVDTSVAHLCGALGRNTSILLPFKSDWRWLIDRNDSPWYSSVKLYRQESMGDWAPVLDRVTADLVAALDWPSSVRDG
jgi:tetratricopeptide (TPR) repeat protein